MLRIHFAVLVVVCGNAASAQVATNRMIGINVLLNRPVGDAILADLNAHWQVLDVLPEINAVTVRAHASELPAIQALPYVAAANADVECYLADDGEGLPVPDFTDGANVWNLDAINVTDFGGGRTVAYDGEGVYIAVIDTGLVHNWREYFPEDRIATQFARGFGGGGGDRGTVSELPQSWERDTNGHGTAITSIILGFHYSGPEPLPAYFNGVAPKATVIPIDTHRNRNGTWHSRLIRAILYLTDLRTSGALGNAPLVINASWGDFTDDAMLRAAIDYAIANGVVVVAAAGNDGETGMLYPGAYAPVISAAASAWVAQFPADDPTHIGWTLRDVPENDIAQHLITGFSGRELPGQDLDVAAPGAAVPVAWTANGRADYAFFNGTSAACPHVAGVAALMLQKNPNLTAAQIENILESSAMPLPPGCRDVTVGLDPAHHMLTWSDLGDLVIFDTHACWQSNATGAGLLQADAALAATPLP